MPIGVGEWALLSIMLTSTFPHAQEESLSQKAMVMTLFQSHWIKQDWQSNMLIISSFNGPHSSVYQQHWWHLVHMSLMPCFWIHHHCITFLCSQVHLWIHSFKNMVLSVSQKLPAGLWRNNCSHSIWLEAPVVYHSLRHASHWQWAEIPFLYKLIFWCLWGLRWVINI